MSTQVTDVPPNGNGEHTEPEQPQSTTTAVVQPEQPKAEAPKEEGPKRAPMGFGKMGVILTSLNELWQLAKIILESGMAPRGLNTVAKVTVAIQFGAEFGVPPLAAVRGVAVIEGQPSWKGDMALALCRASGLLDNFKKWHEGEGMKRKAIVVSKRKDDPEPMRTEFNVDDAILAGLWGMTSRNGEPMPWKQYPDRMLYYRALGFNLRDNFPEVMMGTVTAEERADYPPATDVTPISATSAPRALAAAPPPDPLLVGLGLVTGTAPAAKPPAEEAFVLVDPPKPAEEAKPTRIAQKDCSHPEMPPSRIPAGKTRACPDCLGELQGDPLPRRSRK